MRRHAENYLKTLDDLKTLVIGKTQPHDVEAAHASVQLQVPTTSSDDSDGGDAERGHLRPTGSPGDDQNNKNGNDGEAIPKNDDMSNESGKTEANAVLTQHAKDGVRSAQDIGRHFAGEPNPHHTVSRDQLVKLLLHRHRIKKLWSKMDETIQEEKQRNDAGEKYAQLVEQEKYARLRRMTHYETILPVDPLSRRPHRSPLCEEWHLDDWLWEKALDDARRKQEHWYKKDEEGKRIHKI